MTPPTTSYKFGDVVLAPFPFTGQTASKQRPAVIISSAVYNATRLDIILMPISSRSGPAGIVGEVTIIQWQAANLLYPSVVKPIIATLEHTLIKRKLGELQPGDQHSLKAALQNILG
jgi:mRNA interferase MazF